MPFEQVGTSVMTVGARDGAISLTMELAAGTVTTAVFAVTDEVGGSLRFTLSVRVLEAGIMGRVSSCISSGEDSKAILRAVPVI